MTMRLVYSQYNSSAPQIEENNPTYDPKEKIKKDLIDKIENDELINYSYNETSDGVKTVDAEIKFYRIYENIVIEDSSTN